MFHHKIFPFRVLLFAFLGSLSGLNCYAQELDTSPLKHEQDFQIWTSVRLSKEITKKLSFTYSQGFRSRDNLSSSVPSLSDFEFTYKLSKAIRFSGTYRYQVRDRGNRSRVHTDLVLRKKVKRFTGSLRTRVQRRFEPDDNHRDFLRERIKLEYNIRKNPFSPYVATEWFYRFHFRGNQWQTYRADIGTELKLAKRTHLLAYYRIEREFNVKAPEANHILGLHLKYKLKGKLI